MRSQRSQDALVREQIQGMMTLLEEQWRRLEEEIQRQWERWQQDDPQVAEDLQLLQSMPGVGWWTALTLRLFLPEWGQLDAKQGTALSGLAPMARDSGKKRGRRRIHGGRRRIRGALYMVAAAHLGFGFLRRALVRRKKIAIIHRRKSCFERQSRPCQGL